jgi:hypothetical protein
MKSSPARITTVALATLVWVPIVAFTLSALGRTGPVNAVIAGFAAIWNIVGFWLIRLDGGVTQSAIGDDKFGAPAVGVNIHRGAVRGRPASIPFSKG